MVKRFIKLFLLSGFVVATFSLKCKRCKDGTDCKELEDETCAAGSLSNSVPVCLYQKYTSQDTSNKDQQVVVVKKCTLKTKEKEYECQTPPNFKSVDCKVCDTNFCNEKSAAAGLGAATLGVVAAALLFRLM